MNACPCMQKAIIIFSYACIFAAPHDIPYAIPFLGSTTAVITEKPTAVDITVQPGMFGF